MKRIIQKYFPKIGRAISYVLAYFRWIRSKKNYKIFTQTKRIFIEIEGYRNTFFGYYDKSPFNPLNDNLIIFHANNLSPFKRPQANIQTDICLYNIKDKVLTKLGSTYCWNWQQGSRLHWLNDKEVIYNFYDDKNKSYHAKVINTLTNQSKILPIPVQDSFKDHYVLSIDYKIMSEIRPDYGYRNLVQQNKKDLYFFDLKTNKLKKIIGIKELIEQHIGINYTQQELKAKLNHVMISPNGEKFIFLLRYYKEGIRSHMLFLYSFNGDCTLLIKNNIISHYCWLNDNELFFWGVINGSGSYYKYMIKEKSTINMGFNLLDGHPSKINDNLVLTDTYPDISRMKALNILNLKEKTVTKIAEVFEPLLTYGETRCDLHPKVSASGNHLHCDTLLKNKRTLMLMEYK